MSKGLLDQWLRRFGRTLHPLLDPDGFERDVARTTAATQRQLQELTKAIEQVSARVDRVERIDRRQSEHLEDTAQQLRYGTRQQLAFSDRLLKVANTDKRTHFIRERAFRRLRHIGRDRGPVIIGPWTGEVGFELLYWVPFVRWVVERFRIDPARITLISRGGTASWYGLPDVKYVDLLERRSAKELQEHSAQGKKQKNLRVFDRRLMREVAAERRGGAGFVHPAIMYAMFTPYWKRVTPEPWVSDIMKNTRITPPEVPGLETLPRDYVAVRFYFSDCFPDTPANRALSRSVVDALARTRDVVVIGSGVQVDDHRDADAGTQARVHTITHLLKPENNLAVQTAVIARAKSFIGTYGGFSYLAPLCGVDAVGVYSVKNFYAHHLDFAQRMFAEVGGGSLTVVDTAVSDLIAPLVSR